MLYPPATERSDRAIVDAVGMVAGQRGVSRAQIALAWLRTNPVVVAPLVGASKTNHVDDAISSLDVELTGEEIAQLESPYGPRRGPAPRREPLRWLTQIAEPLTTQKVSACRGETGTSPEYAGFGASREMFCSKGQTLAAMGRLPGYGTG
jgi:hypothetical protein